MSLLSFHEKEKKLIRGRISFVIILFILALGSIPAQAGQQFALLGDGFKVFSEDSVGARKTGEIKDSEPSVKDIIPSYYPIEVNARVTSFLDSYRGRDRWGLALLLKRSGRYRSMIQQVLREQGLPDELIYVPLIESGFDPKARSLAGATGLWQFMPATARRYGLVVNWWVDERLDAVKSTRAAARYLKDLVELFGDWSLAQAGYNAGETRILKALNRSEQKDYWALAQTRQIASETRNYVPKLLAATIIAENPEIHGFGSVEYDSPLRYEEVLIPWPMELSQIASGAGVSLEQIRELNPALLRSWTPPNYPGFKIKVPQGKGMRLTKAIQAWDPDVRGFADYKVQQGDSLELIARNSGVQVETLAQVNGLSNPDRISVGLKIKIPVPEAVESKLFGPIQPGITASLQEETLSAPSASSNGHGSIAPKEFRRVKTKTLSLRKKSEYVCQSFGLRFALFTSWMPSQSACDGQSLLTLYSFSPKLVNAN
jgi:LysM repeat protein